MSNLPKQPLTFFSLGGLSTSFFNCYSPEAIFEKQECMYFQSHQYYFLYPGYIIAIVARLWPALAKSVVLINSGGNVIPGYSSAPFTKVSLIKTVQEPYLSYVRQPHIIVFCFRREELLVLHG